MSWMWDNAVLIAFLVALVAVAAAIGLLVLRALSTWRAMRGAGVTMSAAGAALSADIQRVTASVERASGRGEEIAAAVALVRARAEALSVLARHVAVARRVLLGPLRYIGR